MSGFRDELGAARQRQEELERENADLRAELDKEREAHAKERDERAKEKRETPRANVALPRWVYGVLAATVACSGLFAFWVSRRTDTVPPVVPPPPTVKETATSPASATVGFTAPAATTTAAPGQLNAWGAVPIPEKVALHALDAGFDVVYAVGDHGTILRHYRAEDTWTKETSATTANLYSVSTMGQRVMACGDEGTIVALPDQTTTAFHVRPAGTKKTLRAIAMTSFGLIAVGDEGTIVRGNWIGDGPLDVAKSPTTKTLRGICSALGESWIVGDGGTLLRVTLTSIDVVDSGTTENLNAVACDPGKIVAVGDHGTVTQRTDPRAKFAASRESDADWLSITTFFGMSTWVASGRGAALSTSWATKRGGLTGDIHSIRYTSMGTFACGPDGLFVAH